LAYFVYFGSIVPWEDFNAPELGITPWRLVVTPIGPKCPANKASRQVLISGIIGLSNSMIGIRLKKRTNSAITTSRQGVMPSSGIKTWREALFAGHFGPIGVGAIFAAILARAELENDTTQPLPENVPRVKTAIDEPCTRMEVMTMNVVMGQMSLTT
jgi:NhaP-type Na+/H+ or K+/H+ antiporter